ncbi:hypothetical protein JO972_15365 [Verrucomicrobiaceae bacterium 5K15]|uniref:Uncharacterized protein n=1 Tax=Oceaniferula flava TaxID=2800421 RepID=A0AAE2VEX6_9BACT|nr:hypothetical protein [Oceaniferula flavus]MBK1856349.1 hypothetical protein [Oceaniferula flavus]MBM1137656.1 hypothetical protein [Oceaniferula flavus]
MNLTKFKKTIGKNNPEKGLHSLVGAQKGEHRDALPSTVRVKGVYRSVDHGRSGNFFGVLAYIVALFFCVMMVLSILDTSFGHPLSYLFIGVLPVHAFAMVSDGINSSKTPWALKTIKLFWITGALVVVTIFLLPGRF